MSSHPRSWLSQAFGACLTILFAAIALTVAAHLLVAVWRVLAVAALVVAGLFLLMALAKAMYVRSRYR